MPGSRRSVEELRQNLHETQGVINILERARQELTMIIDWDSDLRGDPLRQRQLTSICEQLDLARGRQSSTSRLIDRMQSRP
jgi:hypothetical protein